MIEAFIADTHFYHENIMKYCRRDVFMTPEEIDQLNAADRGEIDQRTIRISEDSIHRMNQGMIDGINAVVGEKDVLHHIGDVFWGHDYARARAIRDQIKCQTIHHIWGNHDEPEYGDLFASSDKYAEIVVEKQKIFMCHYPMRAWDKSHKGSICLFGHVHNLYAPEDRGELMPYQKHVFTQGFSIVLQKYMETDADNIAMNAAVQELLDVVASVNGIDLTLDVGVDNDARKGVPFGTPWTMADIRGHMSKKRDRWLARAEIMKSMSRRSTLK